MTLKGDVKSLNLAGLFQDISTNKKSGVLSLEEKNRRLHFWFEEGLLRLVGLAQGEGPSVVNGLIALGHLPVEALPETRKAASADAALLRKLRRRHSLTVEQLCAALEDQMTDYVCEAFLWSEAHYTFEEADPTESHFDLSQLELGAGLSLDKLMMEALRRQDEGAEIRRTIPSFSQIYVADASRLPENSDALTHRLVQLLDGSRTVLALLTDSRLGSFTVLKVLAQLSRIGAIRPLNTSEIVDRARTAGRSGKWEIAARLCACGLEMEPGHIELRELAADAAEGLGQTTEAIQHLRQFGRVLKEQGDRERALATFRRLLDLAPRDLYAHDEAFQLVLALNRADEAGRAAQAFVAAARAAGAPEQARQVYDRLIDHFGDAEEHLEALADVQRRLGDHREASALYATLLQRAQRGGNDVRALHYGRALLTLDPKRTDVRDAIQKLSSGEEHRLRSKRRRRKILLAIASLLLILLAAGAYEGLARLDFDGRREALMEATQNKRYREALDQYDAFLGRWGWSFKAREIVPDRELLEHPFVEETLASTERLLSQGALMASLEEARTALSYSRTEESKQRTRQKVEDLEGRVAFQIKEQTTAVQRLAFQIREKTRPEARAELAAIRNPLAVEGLSLCLRDPSPDVRLDSVTALGSIDSPSTLRPLVEALLDPEASIRTAAAGYLTSRTAQTFGENAQAWEEWRLRSLEPSGHVVLAQVQPLHQSVSAEGVVQVEWRIANISSETLEVTVEVGPSQLRILGPVQQRLKTGAAPSQRSQLTLSPGTHLGGTWNLTDLGVAFAEAGTYTITWSPKITVEDAERSLESLPVRVERKP